MSPARSRLLLAVAGVVAFVFACSLPPQPPPQPIAFSHSSHAAKEIPCGRCHRGAERGPQAGLPPLATCAACHRRQVPDHPEVKKLMALYEKSEPLLWPKVNVMPSSAMVHFKHKPHARAGVECVTCHGDVTQMSIVEPVVNVADMGWCLDCHRESGASLDCLTCHH